MQEEAAAVLENVLSTEEMEEDNKNVKIAVTTDENKNVYGHFGSATLFTVYTMEDGKLVEKKEIANAGTGHTSTVETLVNEGVTVLLCGGIGGPAMQGLLQKGILVIPGLQGDVDVAVSSYLDGSLTVSTTPTCNHHDHEDGEGCNCGEDSEEEGCHCGCHCCH